MEARYREKATLEARLREIEKLLRADPKEVKRVKAQLQREERNLLETLRKPHSAQHQVARRPVRRLPTAVRMGPRT